MAKEYIERGKLESILKNRYDRLAGLTSDFYAGYMLAFLTIKYDVPTAADVVEVVRCRECVHWKPIGSKAGNSFSDMEYIGGCEFTKYCRRESDFCSYGERKGGAD